MRLYRLRSSAEVALGFSEDFTLGLDLFDQTRPLIAVVEGVHGPLEEAHEAVAKLVKPRRKAKRQRDIAEWRSEKVVDEVAAACEAADDHRKAGPTSKAVLPGGVGPVKAPKGKGQVAALEKLANYLGQSNDAKVKGVADALGPRLREAAATLDAAETAYQAARKAWRDAEDLEDVRLSEHRRTMDSLLGELRKLFPGDRSIQNLIAPVVDDGDDKPAEPEAPTPTPAPS